jgi:hypothetical protein
MARNFYADPQLFTNVAMACNSMLLSALLEAVLVRIDCEESLALARMTPFAGLGFQPTAVPMRKSKKHNGLIFTRVLLTRKFNPGIICPSNSRQISP